MLQDLPDFLLLGRPRFQDPALARVAAEQGAEAAWRSALRDRGIADIARAVDGPYAVAEFDRQQGMALVRDTLYVADTENHMLRAVNLTGNLMKTSNAETPRRGRLKEPFCALSHAT